MGVDFRLPNITGATEREQLAQIKSYLNQLIPQLQWVLNNVEKVNAPMVTQTPKSLLPSSSGTNSVTPQYTFNTIKPLIIKSAEIVDAYYEAINRKLEGLYVAQSDFGDFIEITSQEIEENSASTTQWFENIQIIITNHNSDIASIEGSLQTIGEDISYQQNDILTIKGNVEGIASNVVSLESDIGELDTSIKNTKTELSGSIDNAKTQLSSDINSAKTKLTGDINSAKSELSGMVQGVDEDLQNTKTDVNGRIDDTNGSVAGLGEGLNDANSRIAEVDQGLQDAKEVINTSIQGVQDRVTGVNALLEDAKAQLKGSIEDLEILMTGLQNVIIGVTAYLKSGLLYYTDAGIPVYGLEVGQSVRDGISGTEVFKKYARFTSERLSFFDSNDNEVAYISDKKLFIKMAEITVSFKIGGLISLVMPSGDVVEKWVGG